MIQVIKDENKYPFSKGILARSLGSTGLALEVIYKIIDEIMDNLEEENIEVIKATSLRERVCTKLTQYGHTQAEKLYRVSREIAHIKKPIIILIGGGTGVGKSAMTLEVAKRLGIDRIINSDTIREIMRYMIPEDIMPTLHESSFKAGSRIKNPFVENSLIYGFSEQTRLVCEGVRAYIKRGVTEGFNIIINGIHLVPKYLNLDFEEGSVYFFHYILHLDDEQEHIQRFHFRSEGSLREPERYIREINDIRSIQEYIIKMSRQDKRAVIVENNDFEQTVNTILNDITLSLEKDLHKEQKTT